MFDENKNAPSWTSISMKVSLSPPTCTSKFDSNFNCYPHLPIHLQLLHSHLWWVVLFGAADPTYSPPRNTHPHPTPPTPSKGYKHLLGEPATCLSVLDQCELKVWSWACIILMRWITYSYRSLSNHSFWFVPMVVSECVTNIHPLKDLQLLPW